jgi:CxxC-x17-CxxC domain-containing protein
MKTFKRDGRSSGGKGGKKFSGGRSSWKGGSKGGSFDREQRDDLHDATCSECGNKCQVPFKPNGRKPVLCRNCFKKDGAPGRFSRDSFHSKKSFSKFDRAPQADNGKIEARLDAIENKIDTLIEALTQAAE